MWWAVLYTLLVAWVSGTLGAAAGPHAWVSPGAEAPAPTVGRPPGAPAGERAAAGPLLQLRGGGKKKETDQGAAVGKGKGKSAGGGDELEEIGGLRPEPYEEPDGGRVDFHNVKLKQLADLKSGVLQPSAGLKALKRDRNIFPKKGDAPDVFLRRYRDANRSLNPYASVTETNQDKVVKKAAAAGTGKSAAAPEKAGEKGGEKGAAPAKEKPAAKGG